MLSDNEIKRIKNEERDNNPQEEKYNYGITKQEKESLESSEKFVKNVILGFVIAIMVVFGAFFLIAFQS